MTGTIRLRVGTRGSRLALAQARIAAHALEMADAGFQVELVVVRTAGDELSEQRPSGAWLDSDGQFTSSIERLVLSRELDAGIHSLKDLPTASDSELGLAAILERGDARDCLLTFDDRPWQDLPPGARVGTSSPRRIAQLLGMRPDLVAAPIRGNVETRLARLRSREFDALLVAAAGLDRLGILTTPGTRLPIELLLPAPGQAAIAIQCRHDHPAWSRIAVADDRATRAAVDAERALLTAVGGGCLAPIGTYATVADGRITLRAAFLDARERLRHASATRDLNALTDLVTSVASALLGEGATSARGAS